MDPNKKTGYVLYVAALGSILVALAPEISALADWSGITQPTFVGKTMLHIGAVIGAYFGGKYVERGS